MEKVFIKDKQDNKVLPITHVSAVLDDEGNDLGSHLGNFEDEVRGLVDTPHQEYVTVATYASLTQPGSKDTIYRVSNYNGSTSQVDTASYSEYAWDGTQYVFLCVKSQIGEVFDISVYNNNAKYADLAAALNGGANIPQSLQKGGMSVKFVQSSDNKYVQYRLMADTFNTTVANWQGVDDEPTAGSDNLVKSGGVKDITNSIQGFIVDAIGGGYIDENGHYTPYVGYGQTTEFVKVKEGDIIMFSIKSSLSSKALWGYSDVNESDPICLLPVGSNNIQREFLVIVPSGVNYIRGWGNLNADCYIKVLGSIGEINTSLYEMKIRYSLNGYLNENGAFVANSSYIATDYIDVSDYAQVKISCLEAAGSIVVWGYTDTLGSNATPLLTNISSNVQTIYNLCIPKGIKFIRACGKAIGDCYIIKTGAKEIYKQLITEALGREYSNTVNGYIDTDGSFIENNNYIATDMINVRPGEVIECSTYVANGTEFLWAYTNASGSNGIPLITSTVHNTQATYKISMPENRYYIRAFGKPAGTLSVKIQGSTIFDEYIKNVVNLPSNKSLKELVENGGTIYLENKTYYINETINVPESTKIIGGGLTQIIVNYNGIGFLVDRKKNVVFENIKMSGTSNQSWSSSNDADDFINKEGIGSRIGIEIRTTLGGGLKTIINQCTFEDFEHSGVHLVGDTASSNMQEIKISDCFFKRCYIGAFFDARYEYSQMVNCSANACCIGAWCQGGNNIFAVNHFDCNQVGFLLNGRNDGVESNEGHSTINSNSFNHNTSFCMIINNVDAGEVISSNAFHQSPMYIKNSGALLFSSNILAVGGVTIVGGNLVDQGRRGVAFFGNEFNKEYGFTGVVNSDNENIRMKNNFYNDESNDSNINN